MPAITAMAMRIRVANIGESPLVLLRNLVIIFSFAPPHQVSVFTSPFLRFAYKLRFHFRNIPYTNAQIRKRRLMTWFIRIFEAVHLNPLKQRGL